ncbi:MAG: SGNH/GDSL hydrolase family protein, partial [Alphaproteobacteria bacterium]
RRDRCKLYVTPTSRVGGRVKLRLLKRAFFTILPLFLLLFAVTILLTALEKEEVIDTERPDDRVSYATNLFIGHKTIGGENYFVIDDESMVFTALPAEKSDRTFRILITGGSFAMGSPWVHQDQLSTGVGGISDWLRAELEMRFPQVRIELINAGVGGQNSNRVRQILPDLLAADPDVVVVAMGNNEGYAPATPINEPLHRWVIYRAMKKVLLREPAPAERPYFAPQNDDTALIEKMFQENVRQIVALAKKKSVRLGLATMPINYRYLGPGPEGVTIPEIETDEAIKAGLRLAKKNKCAEAVEQYLQSEHHALAARYLAECFAKMGQHEKAREFYQVYVQHLPLNRMRPSYNEFLRQIAREENTLLFDLQRAAEAASPHGIPDETVFFDYCHLTWQGYQLMAAAIAQELIDRGLLTRFGAAGPRPTREQIIETYHWQELYDADLKLSIRRGQ